MCKVLFNSVHFNSSLFYFPGERMMAYYASFFFKGQKKREIGLNADLALT